MKSMSSQEEPGYHTFQPEEVRYEDIWNLFNYAKEHLDSTATIVDADDLIRDPEGLLRKYCAHYGIEYCDKMLHWDANVFNEEMEKWGASWFSDLVNSATIRRDPNVTDLLKHPPDLSHFTDQIRTTIQENLVFYQKLYKRRLTVQ